MIGPQYNVSARGIAKRYKKWLQEFKPRGRPRNVISETEDDMPDYGDIEPTGKVSDLNNDQWAQKYCKGHTWENKYLTKARDIMWLAFRLLILLPRNHGKTWICIELYTRWILEKRTQLIVVTAGGGRSEFLLDAIAEILTSREVRLDYGDIAINIRHSPRHEIIIHPSMRQPGHSKVLCWVTSRNDKNVIGSHPGWLSLEDIIQEPFASGESNERLLRWWKRVLLGMRGYEKSKETKITLTGTRNDPEDFYQAIIDDKQYKVHHEPAVTKVNKQAKWPTFLDCLIDEFGYYVDEDKFSSKDYDTLDCPNWPLNRLLGYRATEPREFSENMQNVPIPIEGEYFEVAWKTKVKESEDYPYLEFYMFMDPARGKSSKADFTCLLIVCIWEGHLVIVDGIYERGLRNKEIKAFITSFRTQYRPGRIFVKCANKGGEVYLWEDLRTLGYSEMERVIDTENKVERIKRLDTPFITKKIVIDVHCPIADNIHKEYVQFDQTESNDTKKDDALDTIATGWEKLKHKVESHHYGSRAFKTLGQTRRRNRR